MTWKMLKDGDLLPDGWKTVSIRFQKLQDAWELYQEVKMIFREFPIQSGCWFGWGDLPASSDIEAEYWVQNDLQAEYLAKRAAHWPGSQVLPLPS